MVTTSQDFVEAVRESGSLMQTRLTMAREIASEINVQLSARQDVLMAMIITEDAVAASEIVSFYVEVDVFGIVSTDDGTAAAAGVSMLMVRLSPRPHLTTRQPMHPLMTLHQQPMIVPLQLMQTHLLPAEQHRIIPYPDLWETGE